MKLQKEVLWTIQALAERDYKVAKYFALKTLEKDTSLQNRNEVEQCKGLLQGWIEPCDKQIPYELRNVLIHDDLSQLDNCHYFVAEKRERILREIAEIKKAGKRLKQLKISYKNTTLLYGTSGTGKTMFARYVAKELKLPLFVLDLSKAIEHYFVGDCAKIADAFDYVNETPCVFLIDGIDSICERREFFSRANREVCRLSFVIAKEIDRLSDDAIMIATTYRPDELDPAVLNRFSQKYEFVPYSDEENKQMIAHFLNNLSVDLPEKEVDIIVKKSNPVQREVINYLVRSIAQSELLSDDQRVNEVNHLVP